MAVINHRTGTENPDEENLNLYRINDQHIAPTFSLKNRITCIYEANISYCGGKGGFHAPVVEIYCI